MTYEQITDEIDGNLLILTLNRPERLNAWTHKMNRELSESIIQANKNPLKMYSSSLGERRQLRGKQTEPDLAQANCISKNSGQLGSNSATRSPLLTPFA